MAAVNRICRLATGTKVAPSEKEEDNEPIAGDALSLSQEARQALELPALFGTEPGEPITVKTMRTFATNQLDTFAEKFRALMRANDIDTSQPIELGHEPGTGRLIVTNDHPDAEKIETLLEENPILRNMYTGATSTLSLAKHAEEHRKFAEAYTENPQAAMAQYAYLFNTRWDTSVAFSEDSYEVAYDRVPRLA
jgi:hypothetical protein